MARRCEERAEVESLSEALEGAAVEKQGLMKAFAIANSIHVVQSEDPPTEVSGGESAMEIYHRKCSKVHRVATGKLEDGTNDPGWLYNNACFAILAHRLVRITEPKKWQP